MHDARHLPRALSLDQAPQHRMVFNSLLQVGFGALCLRAYNHDPGIAPIVDGTGQFAPGHGPDR